MTASVRALAALGFLYAVLWAIVARLGTQPGIAVGATLDLTLTAGALTWWLGVRRAAWPRWSIAAVVVLGAAGAALLVPGALGFLAAGWVFVELALTSAALVRLRSIVRKVRGRAPGVWWIDGLEDAMPGLFGRILAGELGAIAYGLGGWFRRGTPGRVTLHRVRSWSLVAGVIAFLLAVETLALHLVLAQTAGPIPAWIATGLSLYALLWIAGDAHALRLGGVRSDGETLDVRVGLRWRVRLPRSAIEAVIESETAPVTPALSAPTIGTPNVWLLLRDVVEVRGPFGIRRRVRAIGLSADDPEALRTAALPTCAPGAPGVP